MIIGREEKGSKHQLQEYVNSKVDCLNSIIAMETGFQNIKWISPLKIDDYLEIYDSNFRRFIDSRFIEIEWEKFWPMRGGPRWDGIAVSDNNSLLLVEAKSYPKEAIGKGSGAKSAKSRELIERSLQKYAGNSKLFNSPYYQFANRVAFTNFLNQNGIDTILLLLNFYEDSSHTNPKCIVSKEDFIEQSVQMISSIETKYQSHVVSIYVKAIK